MTPTATPIAARLESGMVTIRGARSTDEPALTRLAGRDTRPLPRGKVIVAELDGELVAARSLTDGHAVADPFLPTGQIAQLLALAARSATSDGIADQDRSAERGRSGALPGLARDLTGRLRARVAGRRRAGAGASTTERVPVRLAPSRGAR